MILLNQTIPNNPKPSQTKPNQTKPPQTAPDFLHFLSLVAQSWHSYRVGSDLQIQTPVSAFLFVWNVIWVRVKIWHIYVLQWEGPVLAFLFVCNNEGIVICVYKDMATTEKWGLPDQKKNVGIKTKDLSDQLTHYVPLGRQVALNPVLKTGCLLRWKKLSFLFHPEFIIMKKNAFDYVWNQIFPRWYLLTQRLAVWTSYLPNTYTDEAPNWFEMWPVDASPRLISK